MQNSMHIYIGLICALLMSATFVKYLKMSIILCIAIAHKYSASRLVLFDQLWPPSEIVFQAETELLQFPFRTEFSMGSLSLRYRRSLRSYRDPWGDRRSPMKRCRSFITRLTKNHKTLLHIVKHHETLVKHFDTSCNIVKHREPLLKHHETLKTLWNIMKHS